MSESYPWGSVADRMEWLLQGRSAWKWAQSVHLSSGALSRLLVGKFPDPEKLIPACRIENLSLTWLLEGRGPPYGVATPADDEHAAAILQQILEDEPDTSLLVCHAGTHFTVIASTPVTAQTAAGKNYAYRATTILGGGVAGPGTVRVLTSKRARAANPRGIHAVRLELSQWRDLASGLIGNHHIFGPEGFQERAALNHLVLPTAPAKHMVRDEGAPHWHDEEEHGALELLRSLDRQDHDAAMRMLKGLRDSRR